MTEKTLLTPSTCYKPFRYPWAYEAWKTQQALHWISDEVPLADDIKDWRTGLTECEISLLTQIFRMFTQQDVDVNNAYLDLYIQRFRPNEVRMMLTAFANVETIHQSAYSYLVDTLGLPETEYEVFLEYQAMADKHEFLKSFNMDDHHNTALSMAVFAGFTEGLQLFASFAMLMNFPRFNKMKGMGQIVTWSVRDENCMSDDTEVLTENGWKLFADLDHNEKLAQFSGFNNDITFAKPLHYIAHHHKGEMIHIHSHQGHIDILCTPDHDLKIRYTNQQYGKDRIDTITAGEKLKGGHYRFPVSGNVQSGGRSLSALEKFAVALQADGSLPNDRYSGKHCGCLPVNFTLKKKRKQKRLEQILNELEWDFSKNPTSDGKFVYRVKVPLDVKVSKDFSDMGVNLTELTHRWATSFVQEIAEWDGHRVKDEAGFETGRILYTTTSRGNAEFVQTIAVMCGWRPLIKQVIDNRKSTFSDVYRVHLTPDTTWHSTNPIKYDRVEYDGMVYCVTMPEGTIVTRRNQAVGFVGNCHISSVMKLFHTYCAEFRHELDMPALRQAIGRACAEVVQNEDRFIEQAFSLGPVEGLTEPEMKHYIRFIANHRLRALGCPKLYDAPRNPLPWMEEILNLNEHANFFETRATEYSKGQTQGQWSDVNF